MPSRADAELPFHLRGPFAPTSEERTDYELPVLGEVPRDLAGIYLRNGPNPRTGRSPIWFAGEGMLHGVRLEAGRARWYRNRAVRGPHAPNTHVVRHAGRILALVEAGLPVEVTSELETIGPFDFGGALARAMTAHPKTCPRSGELLFFGNAPVPPQLTFFRADPQGRIIHHVSIELPSLAFMHDFAITERYAVFYVLPVLVDFRSAAPFRWADDFPARIGVLPRSGGSAELRWFDVAPCTISHTVNAFEEGHTVVLDAVRAPRPMAPHALHRFILDQRSGRVSEIELDTRFLDYPRVHPAFVGVRHRYACTTELCDFAPDGGFSRTMAQQYDFDNRRAIAHDFGEGKIAGECVVVPRLGSRREADAWVMLFVHAQDGSASELAILDAERFAAPPVATVRLPARVPLGFHGDWFADPP